MIAVLAIGLVMAGIVEDLEISRTAGRYRREAQRFSAMATSRKADAKKWATDADRWRRRGQRELAGACEKYKSMAEYAASYARGWQRKYEYAASHPWLGEPPGAPGTYPNAPSMRAATQTMLGMEVVVGLSMAMCIFTLIALGRTVFRSLVPWTTGDSVNAEP